MKARTHLVCDCLAVKDSSAKQIGDALGIKRRDIGGTISNLLVQGCIESVNPGGRPTIYHLIRYPSKAARPRILTPNPEKRAPNSLPIREPEERHGSGVIPGRRDYVFTELRRDLRAHERLAMTVRR